MAVIQQPNPTLYVSNMDWSIKKPLLKRALYSLYSRHGKVLEIIALRKDKLRGQAWIIFDDVSSATAALQATKGYTFFGKDLKVDYAKEKSDRIAKRDGTYVPKAKRRKVVTEESDSKQNDEVAPATTEASAAKEADDDNDNIPSNILFAQDLPAECNQMMLAMLFQQYTGYKEVRVPRQGLAFIEFDDEPHATLALQGFERIQIDKYRHAEFEIWKELKYNKLENGIDWKLLSTKRVFVL